MSLPLLSIVTVTKDDPPGLERTLLSCAAMRDHGAEHLVIDGSAVPATIDNGGNHRVLPWPPRGIANAFNAGVAGTTGEWIWFLNGGDVIVESLSPVWLSQLLVVSRADLIIGGLIYGEEAVPRAHPPISEQWPISSWVPHPATIFRRSFFASVGGFDDAFQIAMDFEWWLRCFPERARADVISVPMARFALGGLSQRSDLAGVISEERARALRRHRMRIAGAAGRTAARVARTLALASLPRWLRGRGRP